MFTSCDAGSFFGSLIGAVVVLITVLLTIFFTQRNFKKELRSRKEPYLIYQIENLSDRVTRRESSTLSTMNELYSFGNKFVDEMNKKGMEQTIVDTLSETLKSFQTFAEDLGDPIISINNVGNGPAINIACYEISESAVSLTTKNAQFLDNIWTTKYLSDEKKEYCAPFTALLNSMSDLISVLFQYQDIYGIFYVQCVNIERVKNSNPEQIQHGTIDLFYTDFAYHIKRVNVPIKRKKPLDPYNSAEIAAVCKKCQKQPLLYDKRGEKQ